MHKTGEYWKEILDHMLEGCQIIDPDWRYLYLNDAAAKHARKEKSDLLGRRMMDIFPGIEETQMFRKLADCMALRSSATMVNEFIYADGSTAWFELRFEPVFEGMLVMSLDISESKRTEAALLERSASEEWYSSIFAHIGVGIALIGPHMEIISMNPVMKEWFPHIDAGQHPICYKSFNNPPGEAVCSYCPTIHSLQDGKIHVSITDTPTTEGARCFRIISTPVVAGDGSISAAIEVVEDITERKRAEDLLRTRLRLSELAQHGSLDELLQAALDDAERYTDSRIGYFHFVDEDQETLTLQAWSTNTLKNMCRAEGKGRHYPISQAGVWVDCFHARMPVIHNDYAGLSHKKGLPEGHAPVVRELAVPILRDNLVVAVIGVGNKSKDYTQDDVEAVKTLASLVMDLVERKRAEVALKESGERYRSLFENMLEGYAYCRMLFEHGVPQDFIYLDVNGSFERLTGLKNVVGKKVSEVIPGIRETNQELFQIYGRVALTGKPERFETYLDPLGIWFSVAVYSPEKEYFIAVFDNITERKRAEQAREATIDLLRLCNEASSVEELMRSLTLYFQKLTGCEAVGVRLREGDDYPYYETRGFPEEFVLAENSLCAVDRACGPVRYSAGHPALECMCGNIICGRFDPAKPFFSPRGSFWSSCTTELLASTTETDRQARTRNRCNGEGYESVALIPLRAQGETFGLFQFNDKRKGRFTAEKIALLEELVAYVAIALAKLKTDQALHDSERNYRTLVDHALVGVYRSTLEGGFLYANNAMARIFECDSPEEMLSGGVLIRYKNPKDREEFIEKLKMHGKVSNYEIEVPTKSGKHVNILISAALDDGIISGMVLDITEYKKLESQFLQAQKMEAIGQLAGGVAHDFNNILTAIIGYSHITLMKMHENDPLRHYIEQILESSDRATVLTQSLLAFGRKQTVNLAVIDLNEVIKGFEKFLFRLIREDIALEITCAGDTLSIMADRGQIEQVIMNLVTNARDAMPNGGRLVIETKLVGLDREFIETHGYGKEGEYALVSVSDTGIGMDEQTKSKVFEPFFTTKEQGKGTGLGLSMVYGVVKKHNGFVSVYSEQGKGTTFEIHLPIVSTAAAEGRETREAVPVRGGTETILVAEDDADLRKLTIEALTHFGYTVIEAVDGVDAVSKFIENKEKIHLVILDGIMPRMNGKDAFREMRAMSPDVKCIFMSGYAEDIFTKDGVPDQEAELILKPVSPSAFLKKIREVLDR